MTNAIETATSRIRDCGQKELQLLRELRVKQAELAAAEQSAGDQYLESSTTGGVDSVLRIQAEIAAIGRAINSCRARRLQAVEQKLAAEIQELRERAGASRQQADSIHAKTAPLLASLKEIEGVNHVPQGTSHSSNAASMAGLLERQAADLEQRGIRRDRQIHVDNVRSSDDLVIAVLEDASDGPSAVEILRWCELCDPNGAFSDRERSYRLTVVDGVIDYASSYAQVDSLRPALPINGTFTTDAADRNQGRFRAPISMRPPKRPAPAAPVAPPEPPAAAPPETEAPTGGQLVSVDQFFGHAARRGKSA
jgi:hypothetical protein